MITLIILLVIFIIISISLTITVVLLKWTNNPVNKAEIAALTDEWIKMVTVKHNPVDIANLFCPDGTLVGTVSQVIRGNNDIPGYFDFFAKIINHCFCYIYC